MPNGPSDQERRQGRAPGTGGAPERLWPLPAGAPGEQAARDAGGAREAEPEYGPPAAEGRAEADWRERGAAWGEAWVVPPWWQPRAPRLSATTYEETVAVTERPPARAGPLAGEPGVAPASATGEAAIGPVVEQGVAGETEWERREEAPAREDLSGISGESVEMREADEEEEEVDVEDILPAEPEAEAEARATTERAARMQAPTMEPSEPPGEGPRAGTEGGARLWRRMTEEIEGELGQLWGSLFFRSEREPPHTVMLTSPERGAGVTQVVTALALVGAASRADRRVLLIDMNVRHPQVAALLGAAASPGVSEVVRGQATLEECVQTIAIPASGNGGDDARLDVLTAGRTGRRPLGLMQSAGVVALIREAAQEYDHVLIDVAATSRYPDACLLGAAVDGAVLVLRSGATRRETAAEAKKRLEVAGVRVLGLVLNEKTYPIPAFLYRRL